MSEDKSIGTAKGTQELSLSSQVHKESIDFLQIAMKSSNSAIVECALRMAEDQQKHHRSRTRKMHPNLVASLATILVLIAFAGCWFSYTHYPLPVAHELVVCIFALVLILIALYALLAGSLSEANFKDIIENALSRVFGRSSQALKPENDKEDPSSDD